MNPAVACAHAVARPACCVMAAVCIISAARCLSSEALPAAACSHVARLTAPPPLPPAQLLRLPYGHTKASGILPACTARHRQQHSQSCKIQRACSKQALAEQATLSTAQATAAQLLQIGGKQCQHTWAHSPLPASMPTANWMPQLQRRVPFRAPPRSSAAAAAAVRCWPAVANSSAQQPPPAQGAPAAMPAVYKVKQRTAL